MVVLNTQRDIQALEETNSFLKLSSTKLNWTKLDVAFATTRDYLGTLVLPGGPQWTKSRLKYLRVFLGDEVFFPEKLGSGRLRRWRWMLPCMLYRDMTLVMNNLVSFLWHRQAVKDLLSWVQTVLKNFFSDRLYWLPKVALLLSKEVGGQGLAQAGMLPLGCNSSSVCYLAPRPGVEVGFLLDFKNLSIFYPPVF